MLVKSALQREQLEQLRVLDAVAKPERLPEIACRGEGIERLAVRPVADRVDADVQPRKPL